MASITDPQRQVQELKTEAERHQIARDSQQKEMEEFGNLLTKLSDACKVKDEQLTQVTNELLTTSLSAQKIQVQLDVANASLQ
ncbi:hypothetical protein DD594_26045, partial [Enterobacter cloacae complex sp. 4DZ1-17B1]|uniref:hypothetical protein n=1 Tax=Enterobacter cloacae complex sp. 4DZ1-17B1 TaxID=2511991 RepID=UPI0010252D82